MLEPFNFVNMPNDCVIAKSVHNNDANIYCNVINAGDEPVIWEKDKVIGQGFEVDEEQMVAEELKKFNENIKNYVAPCMISFKQRANNRLHSFNSKTNASTVAPKDNVTLEQFITTNDIIKHEVRARLKELSINQNLSIDKKAMLAELIIKNMDCFQWNNEILGQSKLAVHEVNTGSNLPQVQRQYIIPHAARESLLTQLDDMLKVNVCRESNSEWRSPVLLIRKKSDDGKIQYRFCIDLKKVNSVTAKDCYALPLIKESIDCLNGSQYFTSLDVDRAFWQIPVLEKDKRKLAFMVDGKLYEFNVMPFGAMNAPSTFQRLIDRVLRGLTWRQCLVYIDDVLIFSKTFEQHILDVNEVLNRFRLSGLKLKPAKCKIAMQEVDYLGFKVTKDGLRVSDKKIEAITKLKPPETNKLLYSFLCSVNYYRALIPRFGQLTVKLYKMAEDRKKKCVWSSDTISAFEKLRQALITAPVLAFPDFTRKFVIQTDASADAISGVLLQRQNGFWKPISFFSRKLTPCERRYSATEREMLAIREAYFDFINVVYDRQIVFITDHEPLVTAAKLKNPIGRLAKLFHDLVDVSYVMEHIDGKSNHLPDFLSRAAVYETGQISSNQTEIKSSIDWAIEQNNDSELNVVKDLVSSNADRSLWFKIANGKRWWSERHALFINSSHILMHAPNKIVCPESLKPTIFRIYHDIPFAGHRAAETTLNSLRDHYFWFNLATEVVEYCKTCVQCQTFNYANVKNVAPLKNIIVHRPFQLVGMDYMGPFKMSKSGNKYIYLVIDHWTKFAVAVALPTFTAEITAQALIDNVICKFGMVEKVLSDQGVNFEAHLMKHVCCLLGIEKLHTTTYNGAGNGITERLNKTLKPNLAKYVNDQHSDWDEFLQLAVSAYNSSVHSSIGMSPYEALFARPPVNVVDCIVRNQLPSDTKMGNVHLFVEDLKLTALKINGIIEENTRVAQAKQKHYFDRFVKNASEFNVGDLVKIDNFRVRVGHSKSFEPKFLGPFKIINVLGEDRLTYEILDLAGKIQRVHYKRLHKYYARSECNKEAYVKVAKKTVLIKSLPLINNRAKVNAESEKIQIVVPLRSSARIKAKQDLAAEQLAFEHENIRRAAELQYVMEVERRARNVAHQNAHYRRLERELVVEDEIVEPINRDGQIFTLVTGLASVRETAEAWMANVPLDLDTTSFSDDPNESGLNISIVENDISNDEWSTSFYVHNNSLSDQRVAAGDENVNESTSNDHVSASESDGEDSVIMISNELDIEEVVLNEKGKATALCPNCNNRFERIHGLRVHLRSCVQ